MINKDSSDKDILDFLIGGVSVREITSMGFMSWVASKINGAPSYQAATQEVLMAVKNPPLGKMPDAEKVRLIRKLLEIGINL